MKLFLFVEYLKESGKWLGGSAYKKKKLLFPEILQFFPGRLSLWYCQLNRLAAKQRCLERSPTNAARGKLPEKQDSLEK